MRLDRCSVLWTQLCVCDRSRSKISGKKGISWHHLGRNNWFTCVLEVERRTVAYSPNLRRKSKGYHIEQRRVVGLAIIFWYENEVLKTANNFRKNPHTLFIAEVLWSMITFIVSWGGPFQRTLVVSQISVRLTVRSFDSERSFGTLAGNWWHNERSKAYIDHLKGEPAVSLLKDIIEKSSIVKRLDIEIEIMKGSLSELRLETANSHKTIIARLEKQNNKLEKENSEQKEMISTLMNMVLELRAEVAELKVARCS